MADFWTDPKVDWDDNDGIGYEDLNRIEQNTKAVRDGTYRRVQGFGFHAHNDDASYDGLITVKPGSCYSENGVPIKSAANITKNLNAWAQGNGVSFGGMASAVTVAVYKWYYIFVISNPVTGDVEIQFDNVVAGTNITSITFTEKRLIGAFKTINAGTHGSFDVLEMWSDGDNTYINPWGYPATANTVLTLPLDTYTEVTLDSISSLGRLLPLIQCEAFLTIKTNSEAFGLYNSVGYFTDPGTFISGLNRRGEYVFCNDISTTPDNIVDVRFVVSATNKLKIAVSTGSGDGKIFVRGFYWDRLI